MKALESWWGLKYSVLNRRETSTVRTLGEQGYRVLADGNSITGIQTEKLEFTSVQVTVTWERKLELRKTNEQKNLYFSYIESFAKSKKKLCLWRIRHKEIQQKANSWSLQNYDLSNFKTLARMKLLLIWIQKHRLRETTHVQPLIPRVTSCDQGKTERHRQPYRCPKWTLYD